MSNIADTITSTLGFHGRTPDAVTASLVDALEIREAQIQADLLKIASDLGLDEEQTLDTLHQVFSHGVEADTEETADALMAQIMGLTRLLAQQVATLGSLV